MQKRWGSFGAVKRQLQDLDLRYSLLFPARLRVVKDGTTRFFDSPSDAWDWQEGSGLATSSRPPDGPWCPDGSGTSAIGGGGTRSHTSPVNAPDPEQILKER